MKKILSLVAAVVFAFAANANPVVLPATLNVNNVGFRSEGMPDFVIEEGQDYAGTYFDMGAHDSSNDTLLYAEWDVTIQSIQYNVAVDVYNTNGWSVQLDLLNQNNEVVKALRYKGSSGKSGLFAIGTLNLSDLAAGNYKVRVHAATAWSAMKLKDVIFEANYAGVSVAMPGTLLPAYALLSSGASVANGAIAFNDGTAPDEYATWNVSFAQAGSYDVSIDYTASNGHTYGVALLAEDGVTSVGSVAEEQSWDTGIKALGAIEVPAAGNYVVKLTNATQWSTAVLNSITFAGESAAPAHTYTVAGGSAVAFGTTWDATNAANDMYLQEDNTYKWEKTNLTLPAGSIEFKVCEDHAWTNSWPSSNYVINIAEAGIYTIAIYYNPNDNNYVGAVVTKTGDAEVDPTASVKGGWDSWANELVLELAEDKLTATGVLNIAEAGNYEFKVILNGSDWRANGYTYHRDFTGAEGIAGNGDNMLLQADLAGEYTFTWTFANNALAITFPEIVPEAQWEEIVFTEVADKGSLNGAVFAAASNENFTLTVTDTEGKVEVDANNCRFGSSEEYTAYTHRIKMGGKSSSKNELSLAIPSAGTLRIAVRASSGSATDRPVVLTQGETELYNAVVKDEDKTVVDETNYFPYISVPVAAGNVVVTYPVGALNFYAFGFKAAQTGTDIDNTEVVEKAVKMIENGQLIIIKNGVRYNVMGIMVK